ncbi:MAG: Gfo/Idh/MocA family oxidoreductase [bacterium]|nr:Gfo/Idh/MocA family oxidoreductase [bacterium]
MPRVAIFGCGDAGELNFCGLKLAGFDPVVLCDEDPSVLQKTHWAPKNVARCTTKNVGTIYGSEDVDLVVVGTPDHTHLPVASAALAAGKYVWVEKPLATATQDIEMFAHLAHTYPGRLLFSETFTYQAQIQATILNLGELGGLQGGQTSYTMWNCDRIMGGGKWRTETRYNPCAGGLSHNFMVLRLLAASPFVRVCSRGQVLTYHELGKHGGFDTMHGLLETAAGQLFSWYICLATKGPNSPMAHRTAHFMLQFECGALIYGHEPEHDRLIVNGESAYFAQEAEAVSWRSYYKEICYRRMHEDTLRAMRGEPTLHTIWHGINVAAACASAFESAHQNGIWLDIPQVLQG